MSNIVFTFHHRLTFDFVICNEKACFARESKPLKRGKSIEIPRQAAALHVKNKIVQRNGSEHLAII